MQIAWLITVIGGLAAGGLLVGRRTNGRSAQRALPSPTDRSGFARPRRTLAELAFVQGRSSPSQRFVLGMMLLIGVGLVTISWLPARLVPAGEHLAENDRVRAVNDVRGTLLGAFVALGAVIAAARTWRVVAERDQNTQRLTRTIEQLTHPHVELRLAAIFTLEQLARDSVRDRAAIADILCGFVRTGSPWPPARPGQYVEHAPIEQLRSLEGRVTDVQAAMSVLGRSPLVDPRRGTCQHV